MNPRAAVPAQSRDARGRPSRGGPQPRDEPEARDQREARDERDATPTEPCLHCGHPVAVRLMGCKGGHCPNCRHPYPHGDCSD